jgi:rod shape determining protein RodA
MAVAGISIITLILILEFKQQRLLSSMVVLTAILTNIILFQYDFEITILLANVGFLLYSLLYRYGKNPLGTRIRLLGGIVSLGMLAYVSNFAFENILKPHQQDRINVWLKPEKCDPRGSLYNLIQSKMAISSGGISGKGFLNGTYTKLNYVPEQTTDFIFTSICEEQGFIGSVSVVFLFLVIVIRLVQIGENAKNRFVQNYCYAIAGFFFIHFFINIGMTLGIAPVIGIPLPLFSKGGSSFMAFSIMIGIALRMSRNA